MTHTYPSGDKKIVSLLKIDGSSPVNAYAAKRIQELEAERDELLEAAEEFLAIELKTIWPRAYGKSTYNDAFYKLKNAIAKAKGEVSDG